MPVMPSRPTRARQVRRGHASGLPLRLLTALTLALGVLLIPVGAAEAVVTQGITGTLSLEGYGPSSGQLSVIPLDPTVTIPYDFGSGNCEVDVACRYIDTDANGHFDIALPAGEYWVYFVSDGYNPPFAPEWWQNSGTRQDSTKVVVTSGELTNLDTELAIAGKITGTVAQADPAHNGSPDGYVEAWAADSTYPRGRILAGLGLTADDGSYTIDGLPSGTYQLHFFTEYTEIEGWWQGHTSFATATPVVVTAPNTVTDISPTGLLPFGRITGKVTSATDGTPLEGSFVIVHSKWLDVHQRDSYAAADGTYSIPVPEGDYRILVGPPNSHFRQQYWNNATSWATAQNVTVTTNQDTPNIDVALDQIDVMNKTVPAIGGTRRVGSLLTATNGTWAPAAPTFSYQWTRNGAAIAGATQKSYTLGIADLGKSIAARVTANAAGMTPTTALSPATGAIGLGLFTITSKPAISGILKAGKTLRALRPRTTPASSVTYQWLRNGRPIAGARNATYKLVTADRAARIGVRFKLTRPGYKTLVRIVTRRSTVG